MYEVRLPSTSSRIVGERGVGFGVGRSSARQRGVGVGERSELGRTGLLPWLWASFSKPFVLEGFDDGFPLRKSN